VGVYSFVNVFSEGSGSGKESGLALLVQYTIQLSNYLLYFTMSIWEIKGQAVSIERVKPYLLPRPSVTARINAADTVIAKLRRVADTNPSCANSPLINIQSLNFAYESNPNTHIFRNLNLHVQQGTG
jgi:ABC-type multidrug transport system fused ATPase/permease subunit